MPSAEYQRVWRAKRIAEDPTYLERERARQRKLKADLRADPVDGDRLRAKEAARHKKRMKADPKYKEKKREQGIAKYQRAMKNPENRSYYSLRESCRRLNITVSDFEDMFESQSGVCAICQRECSIRKRLGIDHDHSTNEVRGLLCQKCNQGIGRFEDRIDFLQNAINYLLLPTNKKRLRHLRAVS